MAMLRVKEIRKKIIQAEVDAGCKSNITSAARVGSQIIRKMDFQFTMVLNTPGIATGIRTVLK